MKDVYTKEEFETALKSGEQFKVHGQLAEKISSKYKAKKAIKWGGIALIAAGIIALPFTGGASSAGIAAGLTIEMTTAELLIAVGGLLGAYGIHKNCKVEFNSDGSVTITPKD